MTSGTDIVSAVWFFLPAAMANMTPIFAARIFPAWNQPADLGIRVYGHRLLGDHKTVRGFVSGSIVGTLAFTLQQQITPNSAFLSDISWIRYGTFPWYVGSAFGLGALIGDAGKSLVKRRLRIDPGKPWIVFDQIDWIIGMFISIIPWIRLTGYQTGIVCLVGFASHVLSKIIGRMVRLNDSYI